MCVGRKDQLSNEAYLADVYIPSSFSESLLVRFAKKPHAFHASEVFKVQV